MDTFSNGIQMRDPSLDTSNGPWLKEHDAFWIFWADWRLTNKRIHCSIQITGKKQQATHSHTGRTMFWMSKWNRISIKIYISHIFLTPFKLFINILDWWMIWFFDIFLLFKWCIYSSNGVERMVESIDVTGTFYALKKFYYSKIDQGYWFRWCTMH